MVEDDSTVLPCKPARAHPDKSEDLSRSASDLQRAINLVACQLHCAAWALGESQDRGDTELGAQSWTAITACVESLGELDEEIDRFTSKLIKSGALHD